MIAQTVKKKIKSFFNCIMIVLCEVDMKVVRRLVLLSCLLDMSKTHHLSVKLATQVIVKESVK